MQDELVEQQTHGTFVAQGREDLLIVATSRLDHPGCVRAVRGATELRDYFGPTPRSTEVGSQEVLSSLRQQEDDPTDDPTAPRVSTKGSCSTADRTDYTIQYEFLVNEDPPRVVAGRRQITGGQTIPGDPLLPTHAQKKPMPQPVNEAHEKAEDDDDPLSILTLRLNKLRKGPIELE
ncbi:hypothetical protein LR48_Vigan10g063400 [Vigna angularis]|uniref:Uncharacterized protein n=1 Tax=Phaseolus angularis TaxID=3914 RepID=A0A0L9VIK5_PHAAN|nr:hypothetical protein LR48_Vigan10g063400 [Vigna angularis]